MKDAWPVAGPGQRRPALPRRQRRPELRQLLGRVHLRRRHASCSSTAARMAGCHDEFASYAHGSKGSAIISTVGPLARQVPHLQGPEDRQRTNVAWAFPQPEPNPYQLEWDDLIDAIRKDKPYNEVERGAEASLVTSMGRMAAHTGQVITYDEMLNCEHEFAPDVDQARPSTAPPRSKPTPTASTRCRCRDLMRSGSTRRRGMGLRRRMRPMARRSHPSGNKSAAPARRRGRIRIARGSRGGRRLSCARSSPCAAGGARPSRRPRAGPAERGSPSPGPPVARRV